MNHGEKRDQVGHHDTGARGPLESRSHWAEVHSVKLALAKKYRRYQSAASRLTVTFVNANQQEDRSQLWVESTCSEKRELKKPQTMKCTVQAGLHEVDVYFW